MNDLDLQESEEGCEISRRSQICVIGAGIAGLAIATNLARAGRQVLIIESGPETPQAASHEQAETGWPETLQP
jgi:choline dehydrogenase-like flavoprotein